MERARNFAAELFTLLVTKTGSKPKRLSSSSRVIIRLTLLHAYTEAKRKRFRSEDDLGKGAGFPLRNYTPALPSNKLPHPSISLISGESFLNWDLISRTTATGCLQQTALLKCAEIQPLNIEIPGRHANIPVADLGGAQAPICDQTEARKAEKNFWETAPPPPPI